jgi:hypothetical protein
MPDLTLMVHTCLFLVANISFAGINAPLGKAWYLRLAWMLFWLSFCTLALWACVVVRKGIAGVCTSSEAVGRFNARTTLCIGAAVVVQVYFGATWINWYYDTAEARAAAEANGFAADSLTAIAYPLQQASIASVFLAWWLSIATGVGMFDRQTDGRRDWQTLPAQVALLHGFSISHHETFSSTIQLSYSSTKG